LSRRPEKIKGPDGNLSNRGVSVAKGVDPNAADWFELAQLPGLGEQTARRIIAWRQGIGDTWSLNNNRYSSPADLRRVRGIGPKTLKRMSPYLRFSQSDTPR